MDKDQKTEDLSTEVSNDEQDRSTETSQEDSTNLAERIKDLEDQLKRSFADMDNIKKRHQKDMMDSFAYANTNFAKGMLNVLDSIEKAIDFANKDDKYKPIADGIVMAKNEFISVLEKNGVTVVAAKEGDKFDPKVHNALSQISSEDKDGLIANVVQSGYKISDRVLRPASVIVYSKT